MTVPSAFIPMDLLELPRYFCRQEDVQWHLVADLNGAMRLAREQHELSYALLLRRQRFGYSINDLAVGLGSRLVRLGSKLSGKRPATCEDLILWAWVTEQLRRNFGPDDLTAEPIPNPRFQMTRHRDR